jgi:hypothetical protein
MAALFRSLATPRRLDAAEAGGDDAVARLVLDGVLEMEHDGRFVSGPAAHRLYFDGHAPRAASRLAALSCDAMRHGEALGVGDRILQRRLYQFNSRPATPEWRRQLAGDAAVTSFLRLTGGASRGLTRTAEPAWLYWRRSGRHSRGGQAVPTLKLYVSPGIDGMPEALHATLELLRSVRGMVAVKAGREVYGLMRPDNLVAYFATTAALDDAAGRLQASLAGASAQGVPFTAERAGDGLLSWASDPPADATALDWASDRSWRAWITGRVAASLTLAAASAAASAASSAASRPDPVPGWLFALDRLTLDGVDPVTWTPAVSLWDGEPD